TAVLTLPSGASVARAYLYWFGSLDQGPADANAVIERPGGASQTLTAVGSYVRNQTNPPTTTPSLTETVNYLAVADATSFVQTNGGGAYRISGVDSVILNDNL